MQQREGFGWDIIAYAMNLGHSFFSKRSKKRNNFPEYSFIQVGDVLVLLHLQCDIILRYHTLLSIVVLKMFLLFLLSF